MSENWNSPDVRLGKVLEVHRISSATDEQRRRLTMKLGCLPVMGILLFAFGLITSLFDKDDPTNADVRAKAMMAMAGLVVLCFLLLVFVLWLGSSAKKAAGKSQISVYENGLVLTQAGRLGGLRNSICFWNEVTEVQTRTMGGLLLGLTVKKSDGTSVFLAGSFDGIPELQERFTQMGKMSNS